MLPSYASCDFRESWTAIDSHSIHHKGSPAWFFLLHIFPMFARFASITILTQECEGVWRRSKGSFLLEISFLRRAIKKGIEMHEWRMGPHVDHWWVVHPEKYGSFKAYDMEYSQGNSPYLWAPYECRGELCNHSSVACGPNDLLPSFAACKIGAGLHGYSTSPQCLFVHLFEISSLTTI